MILTHDQFGKIPQSLDIQKEIIEDEIRDVEEALEVLKIAAWDIPEEGWKRT